MSNDTVSRRKIRVIVIDDSAVVRTWLSEILSSEADIDVVALAENAQDGRQKIKEFNPDVVTLDIEMPGMNGLDFLEKIMTLRPMPVVIVSTLTKRGAPATLAALENGAVDVVAKPTSVTGAGGERFAKEVVEKVRIAAHARIQQRRSEKPAIPEKTRSGNTTPLRSGERVIAIGSSTGGVEALGNILPTWPADTPPILITQHIPAMFAVSMVSRLNPRCKVEVVLAENGMTVNNGTVYIAPGDKHLQLLAFGNGYKCQVDGDELVSGHCPSVDVLFESVARTCGANGIGIIMTGMGRDGARGLLAMRQAGAQTIGQDEATCVVYGMPRAAAMAGAVEKEVPLMRIVPTVRSLYRAQAA